MGLELYKKGQGSAARIAAYVACGILIVFGAIRLYATINRPNELMIAEGLPLIGDLNGFKAAAFVVGVLGLLALHLLLNRPKSTDLLIETEQEMKKVSWPTFPEVVNATGVVSLVTLVLALTMFGLDEALRQVLFLFLGRPTA
jgi:preprotein translocase SecE subunit